jgi:hypothetical protein
MKKWIFGILPLLAFVLIPLTFTSCDFTETSYENNIEVLEFSHNGHQYLKFYFPEHLADTGTVHNPDCPCFKEKSNGKTP